MATKEQKLDTLDIAIEISKEFARGGSDKSLPEYVLEGTYKTLIKLLDEIESESEKQ